MAPAQAEESDHPLLSRMAGSHIQSKQVLPFDIVKPDVIGKYRPGKAVEAYEGCVTKIDYTMDSETSPVAIYRNYLAAIQKIGGQQLNEGFDANDKTTHAAGEHIFALSNAAQPPIALLYIPSGFSYTLTIIEPKAMEQSVVAEKLADDIKSKGYATLYINFDNNKSDLKDDGVAAVKEIVKLLNNDKSLKLSVDGHTDNIGSATANKKLSLDRARSVMKAIVDQGINAARLTASGYGSEVPIADNRTDEGRGKNRRVELTRIK